MNEYLIEAGAVGPACQIALNCGLVWLTPDNAYRNMSALSVGVGYFHVESTAQVLDLRPGVPSFRVRPRNPLPGVISPSDRPFPCKLFTIGRCYIHFKNDRGPDCISGYAKRGVRRGRCNVHQ